MKKKYITIAIIATVIVGSTIGFCLLKNSMNNSDTKAEYYKIESVEKVYINGVLNPRDSESIYIDSTKGELSEVHVTDGQVVNAGDSLFTYKNTAVEAQISEIDDQITSNENSKESLNKKRTNAKNNLGEKENQVNKLQKQLEGQIASGAMDINSISMNIQQATAEVQVFKEQVSAYDDQIEAVESTLNILYNKKEKLNGEKTSTVTATIGGKVVLSSNEKDYTKPYIIIESEELIVKGLVSEKDFKKIKVDDNISVNIISGDKTVDGKVLEIDDRPVSTAELAATQGATTTNANISYYNVLITLNSQDGLIDGFHSQGKITLVDDTIKILKESIVTENDKNYVFVDIDGLLDKVEVTLGEEDGEYVVINSGLKENDMVMKNPTTKTKEGSKSE